MQHWHLANLIVSPVFRGVNDQALIKSRSAGMAIGRNRPQQRFGIVVEEMSV